MPITALRPGGLLVIGHGSFDGDDLQNAVTRFKTVAHGGTVLDGPAAMKLLEQHRLCRSHASLGDLEHTVALSPLCGHPHAESTGSRSRLGAVMSPICI